MPAQTSKQRKHRQEQRFALDRNMMMGLEAKAVPAVDFANPRNKSLMNLELITANFSALEITCKGLVQICTGTYTVQPDAATYRKIRRPLAALTCGSGTS